jgi:hypothetical protein
MINNLQNVFKSKYILTQEDMHGNSYNLRYFYKIETGGKRSLRFYIPWCTEEKTLVLPLKELLISGEDSTDATLNKLTSNFCHKQSYNYSTRKYIDTIYDYGLTDNDSNIRISICPIIKGPAIGEITLEVLEVPENKPYFDMSSDVYTCR